MLKPQRLRPDKAETPKYNANTSTKTLAAPRTNKVNLQLPNDPKELPMELDKTRYDAEPETQDFGHAANKTKPLKQTRQNLDQDRPTSKAPRMKPPPILPQQRRPSGVPNTPLSTTNQTRTLPRRRQQGPQSTQSATG